MKYRKRNHTRRRFCAIILLMVMMMQIGFKTFHLHDHHHHRVEFSCSDCENHRVHGGHLLEGDGHDDDCTICQMLQVPYVLEHGLQIQPFTENHFIYNITAVPDIQETTWCHIIPRGPPFLLS